ncbi:MAG TPA: prenyltransferase/squalene oxidase repeat-containing protein [Gemmata sp.]|jgi:hypothetical protein|nr:prenyltransferase/squalene oxidase repeat-containing protein [Gemmata sp.]
MSQTLTLLILISSFLIGCSKQASVTVVVVSPEKGAVPTSEPPEYETLPIPRELPRRSPDESLAAGVAYLLARQSADGAWRSDLYATFKDGLALTPLVVDALQVAAAAGVEPVGSADARRKGIEFLARLAKPDGTIDPGPDGIDYPVYTAALTVKVLSHADGKDFRPSRDAWLKYLKERQLTVKLGWKEDEKQYGGWGYCRVIPQKPKPNEFAPNLIESNLSATVFALEALDAAGALEPGTAKAAAVFVRSCQNWFAHAGAEEKTLDGGFHFIYDDPVRNKAGMGAKNEPSNLILSPEFNSYGSATADGLRALDLCGSMDDQSRKVDARIWLSQNFRADTHPGIYNKAHETNRQAVYYYYAASVAKVIREHEMKPVDIPDWATSLANELSGRQKKDGSWVNPVELVRENEPLVATSNAVSALARCKK